MRLEQRPETRQVVWISHHDRVRVADVDHDHVQALDLLRPGDGHRSQFLFHVAVLDARDGLARSDANADLRDAGSICEPAGRDARAVPGQLGRRAVGIPDHDIGLGLRGGDNLDDAVGVPDLDAHALRTQPALVSEQVDVPVRVPLRESHPRPRLTGRAASTLIRSGIFRIHFRW